MKKIGKISTYFSFFGKNKLSSETLQLLKSLQGNSVDIICIHNHKFKILYLFDNPVNSFLSTTKNKYIADIIPDTTAYEKYRKNAESVLKDGISREFELCFTYNRSIRNFKIKCIFLENKIISFLQIVTPNLFPETNTGAKEIHPFFENILENLAIPISIKNMDTEKYIFWSRKSNIFGFPASVMIGKTENVFFEKEQASKLQEFDRKLARENGSYQGVETFNLKSDNKNHTLIINKNIFSSGNTKWLLCSSIDISDIKEQQSEIDSVTQKLTMALNISKLILWSYDIEKEKVTYESYPFSKDKDVFIQLDNIKTKDEFYSSIHPQDRPVVKKMLDKLSSGELNNIQQVFRSDIEKSNNYIWLEMQASVEKRDSDNSPLRLIGTMTSIDRYKQLEYAQRQAKEELEITNSILSSVLSISKVLPWRCDVPFQLFSCDYNIYHHEDQPAPINGKYYCSVGKYINSIHPSYREKIRTVFEDLLSGKRKDFHEEYLVHWYNDHEYEWIDKQGTVYEYDENGIPKTIIGSSIVITERKQMEQSLLLAKEQAEENNRLKSAFLANMSHEIRTPLNAIVGFSEILTTTDDEDERKEYINIIQNNNILLLQLIGDILDLSKIEAGTLEFIYSDVDVNTLLEEVLQIAQMKANSEVSVSFDEKITDCIAYTERNRLLQVINNFVSNSIKFTHKGSIKIGYYLTNSNMLHFYVSDTGCGIASDKINQIFGRFVKLDKFAQGTGLGLAISETIIRKMNGEIGVESSEGEGSTFWIEIPFIPSKKNKISEKPSKSENPTNNNSIEKPLILIAEDNASNYKLFESILKKQYTLLHACNGVEAVAIYRNYRPSLILMDLKMPEMDGYQATKEIRRLSDTVTIIAVTAYAFAEDEIRVLNNGFDDYMSKPIKTKILLEKIEKYIRE